MAAKEVKRSLKDESAQLFLDTTTGMLEALTFVWPEDEILRMSREQWKEMVLDVTPDCQRRAVDLARASIGAKLTDPILDRLNARDCSFFDLIETQAREGTTVAQRAAFFAAALASGSSSRDILSSLNLKPKLLAGDIDQQSIENVWMWLDKLVYAVLVFKIQKSLTSNVLGVVGDLQKEEAAEPSSIMSALQGIKQADMLKMTSALSPSAMPLMLRTLGVDVPGMLSMMGSAGGGGGGGE